MVGSDRLFTLITNAVCQDTEYTICLVILLSFAKIKSFLLSFSEVPTSTEYKTTSSQSHNILAYSGESLIVSVSMQLFPQLKSYSLRDH